ncbi:MAG TPA: LLM class flavin-dependent oxidoreductase [Edaphocola sp.]|nr:LLM class flavin-dependent oxidoreductase [Edaphocola sp.]
MAQNKSLQQIKFSILDLVPVREGFGHKAALQYSVAQAKLAETLGYTRYWIAEHHNAASIVSSATPLLIQLVAQHTRTIRVGSGGVMLPNHTPLVVAEQFGTLATLFPGRIDLGLGRAPGTDAQTVRALRRNKTEAAEDFPRDVQELQFYLSKRGGESAVRAIPGQGTEVPVYLLGSSTFSAQLAAFLGLPYAFASHFAPTYLMEAINIYRNNFKPSEQCEQPYVIAGANVVMADTDEEAAYLSTTGNLFALDIIRNTRKPLQPPVADMDAIWTSYEAAQVMQMKQYAFIGSPETVQKQLEQFVAQTGVDEIIFSSYIYDTEKQARSYELLNRIKEK